MARLRATAHPVRLRILSLLTAEAMSAAEVARALELTHANASYHLRVLHDVGELVVESEEKIRGGVAKRYRYDASREVADRTSPASTTGSPTPAPTPLEVERRLLDAAQGAGLLERPRGVGRRRGLAPRPRPAPRGLAPPARRGPPGRHAGHRARQRHHQRLHDDRRARPARPPAGCPPRRSGDDLGRRARAAAQPQLRVVLRLALRQHARQHDGQHRARLRRARHHGLAPPRSARCWPRTRSRWSLLLLYGGVIADRFPRTLVLQVSNVASALSQGAIAVLVLDRARRDLDARRADRRPRRRVAASASRRWRACSRSWCPARTLQPANALRLADPQRPDGARPDARRPARRHRRLRLGARRRRRSPGCSPRCCCCPVTIPPREPRRRGARHDRASSARAGRFFWATPWLWVVVVGFGVLNIDPRRRLVHARPGRRRRHDRPPGLGLRALRRGRRACCVTTVVLLRVPPRATAAARACSACRLMAPPMLLLGVDPHLVVPRRRGLRRPASGIEVFGMGWNLAMQENIDDEHALARLLLRRARLVRRDARSASSPAGRSARRSASSRCWSPPAVAYVVIVALVLCSRSVRDLPRAPATPRGRGDDRHVLGSRA